MIRSLSFALLLLLAPAVPLCGQATEPRGNTRPLVSPEYHADRKVTFRLRAPKATEVELVGGPIAREVRWTGASAQKIPMQRGDDGVWSLTVGPLTPDRYPYVFEVDGVRLLDPQNMDIVTGSNWPQTYANVPGSDAEFYAQRDVPHGAVSVIPYHSKSLGLPRQLAVYTPPGYEADLTASYPVLYLLHGSGGYHRSWTDDGRVNFIFDNLIAEQKCVPMIVVMPAGHVPPEAATNWKTHDAGGAFGDDLLHDIIPLVEARFRVRTDRSSRALAGLSMGAGQTLAIGLHHLELFSALALLSGGGPSFQDAGPLDGARLNEALDLFWIGCGRQDSLYAASEGLAQRLQAAGVTHVFHASAFDHSFRTWRRDIYHEVAPRLFGAKNVKR